MTTYRLPGATCGESQCLQIEDGTSARWPSHSPGSVNGASAGHASEYDPRTLLRRARGVREALIRARNLVPGAIYRETRCQLGQLLDALLPSLLMTLGAVGAAAVLGGAAGAAIGALAGGVGAVPGAALGASTGIEISVALLTWLGLASLIQPVANGLGELSNQVSMATTLAWAAYGSPSQETQIDQAASHYADAVAVLMRLILIGIVARLTAGQAATASAGVAGSAGRLSSAGATAEATAALIKDLRKSRLGAGFADWVEANSPQLLANPKLRLQPAPGVGGSAGAVVGRASPVVPAAPRSPAPQSQRLSAAAPAAELTVTSQSNAYKGVFGEAKADAHMAAKEGYSKLNGKLTEIGDAPRGRGIDGIWENANPPPEFVISEAKYGSSQLSTLKDGTRQMSDKWVVDRLNEAVGLETAEVIEDAIARGQVQKLLLRVDAQGAVTEVVLPWTTP